MRRAHVVGALLGAQHGEGGLPKKWRRRAAKYDVFPLFGNGDVSWYPPDYRRAIIGENVVLLRDVMHTPWSMTRPVTVFTVKQWLRVFRFNKVIPFPDSEALLMLCGEGWPI